MVYLHRALQSGREIWLKARKELSRYRPRHVSLCDLINTTAGGACTGAGVPRSNDRVVGVMKSTPARGRRAAADERCGFAKLHEMGRDSGETGRTPLRWFDASRTHYASDQGIDTGDYHLDGLDEVDPSSMFGYRLKATARFPA